MEEKRERKIAPLVGVSGREAEPAVGGQLRGRGGGVMVSGYALVLW